MCQESLSDELMRAHEGGLIRATSNGLREVVCPSSPEAGRLQRPFRGLYRRREYVFLSPVAALSYCSKLGRLIETLGRSVPQFADMALSALAESNE